MISAEEFDQARREICALGPASDGDNLLGMEIDFCAYLGDPAYADEGPDLWQDMVVRRSDGAEWLITGRASGRSDKGQLHRSGTVAGVGGEPSVSLSRRAHRQLDS
ncbi:hypothetical protein [Terrabacter sp. BE26]|uniref:hypothetical protein n=1 Tax=Terrabacter sp. BE26 TaxID=2898152 RepID=UPI0035BE8F94